MANTLKILVIIALVGLVGVALYFAYNYFDLKQKQSDPEYLTDLQVEQQTNTKERVLTRLAAIYILPDETNPKIASISNIEQLKVENPTFYKRAVDGDYLVLYSDLAIIYRDSERKIVNVAPIVPER